MKTIFLGLVAAALAMGSFTAAAQHPYKEGPVVSVSEVRTKPGRFDDYMSFLSGAYKAQMEAYKKEGLILDWKILSVAPRTPHDADVILVVTYPNMAVLDQTDRFDEVGNRALRSTVEQQNKAFAERGVMRETLGSYLTRELILK
jgi:hypothetical protein